MTPTVLRLVRFVLLGVALFLTAERPLQLPPGRFDLSLAGLATGVALAAFMSWGGKYWPAVFVGALLANVAAGDTLADSLIIAAVATMVPLLGAWLTSWMARGNEVFDRPKDVLRWTLLAGLLAPAAGGILGAAALAATGPAGSGALGDLWLRWWLSDTTGVLAIAPAVMLWSSQAVLPPRPYRIRVIEGVALALLLTLITEATFGTPWGLGTGYPLAWAFFPVFAYASLRLDTRAAATGALMTAILSLWGTATGKGPFNSTDVLDPLVVNWAFIAVTTASAMSLSAAVTQRRVAQRQFALLNKELEQRVERRTAELTKSESMLADAQALSHMGSWEWDIARDTVSWSAELYRIYGLDPSQPITLARYLERVHPDDQAPMREVIEEAMANRAPFEHWHRIIRPDGAVRTLHARGQLMADAQGRPVRMFGTGRDVTEEREREEQTRLLKEDVRLREDFLAIASHELRTPVTSLRLQIQIVQRLLARETAAAATLEPVRSALSVLADDSMRLVALVNRLLDVTRITTGQLDLQFEAADLRDIVQSGIEATRAELLQRAVTLTVEAPEPVRGLFDRLRVEQVVANLMSNAIRHGEGTPVTVRVLREGGEAVVSVRDQGRGIPAENAATIFNRFDRGSASARSGLGLGLYISRQIVEAHGGTISVSSEIGAGTTFTVRLPVGAAS